MILKLSKIFIFNIKLNISRSIQYRADFLINLFLAVSMSSVAPIVQYLIFSRTKGYPGWTLNQIILFQGCLLVWLGIKDTLFGGIRLQMNQFIQKGILDKLLLKPYSTIGAILTDGFNISAIGSFIAGLAIIIYSINTFSIKITILQIICLTAVYIAGIILYLGVLIIFCSINILIVFIGRLGDVLDKILRFSEYPIEIFPNTGRFLFVTFMPIAVWIYYPAQVLLNRFKLLNLLYLTLFCIAIFIASLFVWSFSIKKYTSAGG